MLNIQIRTIPHGSQRYPTVGDWQFLGNHDEVLVSDQESIDYEFLIAVHELIEMYLCAKRGVSDEEVTNFDVSFTGPGEPGDCRDAPYYRMHQFASTIERLLAYELGVDWQEYDIAVSSVMDSGQAVSDGNS